MTEIEAEHCLAIDREDGYVCTREAGHPVSVGHYAPTENGGIGWVEVPDNVEGGVSRCEHGKLMVFDPDVTYPPMAAPSFWCECCLRLTFYLASSFASFDLKSGESHGHAEVPDTTLCPDCGGQTRTEEW